MDDTHGKKARRPGYACARSVAGVSAGWARGRGSGGRRLAEVFDLVLEQDLFRVAEAREERDRAPPARELALCEPEQRPEPDARADADHELGLRRDALLDRDLEAPAQGHARPAARAREALRKTPAPDHAKDDINRPGVPVRARNRVRPLHPVAVLPLVARLSGPAGVLEQLERKDVPRKVPANHALVICLHADEATAGRQLLVPHDRA